MALLAPKAASFRKPSFVILYHDEMFGLFLFSGRIMEIRSVSISRVKAALAEMEKTHGFL
jgi:hypothetical protein